VAALLLIETGMPAEVAIRTVRAARPGAIETAAQERYVRAYSPSAPAARP
jgi:ADP-ribosyl-[dinitrogen reductase] hydrolase